ncbi:hypothetical protein VTN77DRAFT_7094 [Rasamsonia byssochlamydoides]|uniref:uncharacterized protein n=1 Tax=Rasamsonia byssochlamydoides TaxID=89139 RepID=UPI0037442A6D
MADGTLAGERSHKEEPSYAPRRHATVFWHRLFRSLLYLIAWIFLVLVEIGNVSNKPVLRETYFLKLDMSNIIPLSVPNAVFINSIARSIGLHDFYQVGLWNFCEGYDNTGITDCSKPKTLYFFDPVRILVNELLRGATIALPIEITKALAIARVASHWMFGLFLVGAILSFLAIFITPLAVSSRPPQIISPDPQVNETLRPHHRSTFILFRSLPMVIFTFFTALTTTVASVVATIMFSIFRQAFVSNQVNLNIKAYLGTRMLAFMWIASGLTLIGFIVQVASCCCACCGSRKARRQLKHQAILDDKHHGSNSSDSLPVKRRFGWRRNRVDV